MIAALLSWWERRRALRQLEVLQRRESQILGFDEGNPVNRAKVAISVGDRTAALKFWRAALERYPSFARSSKDSLDIVLGLELYDEAESLMSEGRKRSPRDPFFAGGQALVAERRGDIAEAAGRWTGVRKAFPGYWMGYVHGAMCAVRLGDISTAEVLLKQAVEKFPRAQEGWMERARLAERRGDSVEAIRRWEALHKEFGNAAGDLGVARALQELGRFGEAEERLRAAAVRFPQVAEIPIALAGLAERRCDFLAAANMWSETRRRFPTLRFGYEGGSRLFCNMKDYQAAEAVLTEAAARFPDDDWPRIAYAICADERCDWGEAAARWEAVRLALPGRPDGYLRGAAALEALSRREEGARLREQWAQRVAS